MNIEKKGLSIEELSIEIKSFRTLLKSKKVDKNNYRDVVEKYSNLRLAYKAGCDIKKEDRDTFSNIHNLFFKEFMDNPKVIDAFQYYNFRDLNSKRKENKRYGSVVSSWHVDYINELRDDLKLCSKNFDKKIREQILSEELYKELLEKDVRIMCSRISEVYKLWTSKTRQKDNMLYMMDQDLYLICSQKESVIDKEFESLVKKHLNKSMDDFFKEYNIDFSSIFNIWRAILKTERLQRFLHDSSTFK